ncbi:MAG: primosomal protein N' [Flavobacteriales bacterium]|nr:primosomal protein N' [Flavobacteriales bacterium]MCB9448628.1 primosomal protein N' [Flavobacteriales bacterium]
MSSSRDTYAEVLLPLALPGSFTYFVPEEWESRVHPGSRVVVQFGRRKRYTGIVRETHHNPPRGYQAKYILEVVDEPPPVVPVQMQFWDWISTYYMCHPGEVMAAALPPALRLSSETRICLPAVPVEDSTLTDDEFLVFEALQHNQVLPLSEVQAILGRKSVHPLLRSMLQKGAVMLEEELKDSYKPKWVDFVRLTSVMQKEEALSGAFSQLSKAPRQEEMLLAFLDLKARDQEAGEGLIHKKQLLERCGGSAAVLSGLTDKGILEIVRVQEDRIKGHGGDPGTELRLSELQQQKVEEVKSFFAENKPVLLHGITGSGKTEIYVQLIRETLAEGKQVLYILPEIALTSQIIQRLEQHFGEAVAVYHSRLNEHERMEAWKKLLDEKTGVMLGARSALFLPFRNLGLVIVDEEHETSFKQYDPAPRYHARDASLVLAHLHGAHAILGSATPSLESHQNALTGKFGRVELNRRFGDSVLPAMEVADLAEAQKKKQMHGSFTAQLKQAMDDTLAAKEQIILFQNRRGFSPFIECQVCGWVPQCLHCDVSLTYHKHAHQMRCHYCGYSTDVAARCPSCHGASLQTCGLGTEKVEEELTLLFPHARVMRMDLDSTRTKHGHRNIIRAFENREVDILVGTQMVTKGLHFDHVGLVGILNADHMLHVPEFRAYERAFQLMVQVAGRAGRREKQGRVMIQTRTPEHPIIRQVMTNDYAGMVETELKERQQFGYPPFTRLVRITLRYRDADALLVAATALGQQLRQRFGQRVLGPEAPPIARIRNFYLQHILLKFGKDLPLQKAKHVLAETLEAYAAEKEFKRIRVAVDVDPV